MYSNWQFAFWREFFQNSTDANASRIRVFLNQDNDGVITVIFEDNGSGMSREVLETVYFSLGASTKTGGDTVGGFGRARILTCFSMKNYEIHTQTNLVKGEGGSYDIEDAPQFDGCKVTVQMDNENFSYLKGNLEEYLSQSQLGCRVFINDQQWTTWSYRRQLTRTLDLGGFSFANVHVNKTAANNRLLVRVNGTVMYSQYIRAKAQVIVEVDPSVARTVLTANRDGMSHRYASVLHAFTDELATDTNNALRSRFKNKSATIRGKGLFVALRKKAEDPFTHAINMPLEGGSLVVQGLGQQSMTDIREGSRRSAAFQTIPIAEVTGDVSGVNFGVRNRDAEAAVIKNEVHPFLATEVTDEVVVTKNKVLNNREPEVGERYLKNLPDVFIVDETENEAIRRVMDSYNPENWVVGQAKGKKYNKGGNLYKLLMLWKIACQHAIDSLLEISSNSQISWGIGWVFDEKVEAVCSSVSGGNALLLNPVDKDGCLKFSLRSKKDQKKLMAFAKHEVTHILHTYHDESFASLMTAIDVIYDEKDVFRKMSELLDEGV